MKTTLEIPDPTFRKAKARAAQLGIPLREYVTQAVEEKLSARETPTQRPWMKFAGALADIRHETRRIARIVEEEFGRIEPEDHYAAVRLELKRAGMPIPVNDVWIAALSRQHSVPLMSRDTHFDRVTGLQRRSW